MLSSAFTGHRGTEDIQNWKRNKLSLNGYERVNQGQKKKTPPEGRQYKIGAQSAAGNCNRTMVETGKRNHKWVSKDTARQREKQKAGNRMQVGTKKEPEALASKISWQGTGAEIGKGTGKGKCEAVGQISGRTGVREGTRARPVACRGCRNADTGGTGRLIEK